MDFSWILSPWNTTSTAFWSDLLFCGEEGGDNWNTDHSIIICFLLTVSSILLTQYFVPKKRKTTVTRWVIKKVPLPRWLLEKYFEFYDCDCCELELLLLIDKIRRGSECCICEHWNYVQIHASSSRKIYRAVMDIPNLKTRWE
jgi:hypothetical protein